ncbi:hypothetical protein L3Q82_003904 [Scortum barcoo]|uniref:Uncharacterized protein n=1 Tax=Scortum barcoo TaxID=214431 RepID=A0ACB8X5M7_9TELE|nr:hypothetical protein L3Q82_003904 [Scortum barcoo]
MKRNFIFQHDNDPKHTSKSTKEGLHQNKIEVLERPSQSPDLNPIEHLWGDLKRAVHRRCPRNLSDLEQFCKEEWANIATSRCATLIDSYPKRLSAGIKAKGILMTPLLNQQNIVQSEEDERWRARERGMDERMRKKKDDINKRNTEKKKKEAIKDSINTSCDGSDRLTLGKDRTVRFPRTDTGVRAHRGERERGERGEGGERERRRKKGRGGEEK